MISIEVLSATLRSVAAPGMSPKALRAAVREKHPEASKKEVVRAAFHALIDSQSQDGQAIEALHSFALAERAPDDETAGPIGSRRKRILRRATAEEVAA
jgi:hypothetical protein